MSYRLPKEHPLKDFELLLEKAPNGRTFKECCYELGLITARELVGLRYVDPTVPNEIIYTREGQKRNELIGYAL